MRRHVHSCLHIPPAVGVGVLLRSLEVQQGVLRALPITDVQAERDLCLIWRHDSRLPATVRAFLEVLHAQAPRGQARET